MATGQANAESEIIMNKTLKTAERTARPRSPPESWNGFSYSRNEAKEEIMIREKISPLKQIRKHCLECCGDSIKEVRCCTITECKLWQLRFGKGRKAVIRQKGEEFMEFFDVEKIKDGVKLGPNKEKSAQEVEK